MSAATQIPPKGWERFREPSRVEAAPSTPESQAQDLEKAQRQQAKLQEARERFRDSVNAESNRRSEMLTDQEFRSGKQWRTSDEITRNAQNRPCLTNNRIPGFLSHVVNALRQSRPEIKVDPIAAGADEEIAEIRQGLIRHIENVSRAEVAYDTGFENMATMGLGYMRVVDVREYKSFDRGLRIQWMPNTFSVYEDPGARLPDWSDGRYKFVVEDINVAEFRRRFGIEKLPIGLSEFTSIGDQQQNWIIGGKIRIAEYFHIEDEDGILCELPDKTTIYASDLEEIYLSRMEPDLAQPPLNFNEAGEIDDPRVVQSAAEKRPRVIWTLMYGLGILKERVWEGRYIPIIPIIGNQVELDGDRILVGMVRYAREAQRMFNYMYSCFVEACALAPKAPFIAAFAQIEAYEDSWRAANTDPQAVLYYTPQAADGHLVPPPQRSQAEPPIAAFVKGLELCDANMKAAFRIYEASLGQRGPQESGIAINSRKVESDLATYDWADNFSRALQFLGVVLDDLLEHFYNSPGRIIQILQEDLTRKPVTMNKEFDEDGVRKIYDLSKGKFAITIGTGPSYPTRRREASQAMLELVKVMPIVGQTAPAQVIRSMDFPDKDLIADQVEKGLPPELRTEKEGEEKEDAAELKATLQQALGQVQALTEAVHTLTDQKETERMKEEWATLRTGITAESSIAVAEMKMGMEQSKMLVAEIFEEMKRLRAVLDPQSQPGQQPNSSAPASAAAQPQAPAQPVPPQGANTPAGVGTGQ